MVNAYQDPEFNPGAAETVWAPEPSSGVGAALATAAIERGEQEPEPTPAPIGGAPAPAAPTQTASFNIANMAYAQLQAQIEALRLQRELANARLKVIDLPEAQSRDEQWRRNIVMQTVLNAQQAFGRALPWEFIEQQYMNLPGQGRLGESSPFKPGAGEGEAPEGSYNTVNGPRTLEQMDAEMRAIGWPGDEDVVTAYARTTKGPVTPGKAKK